MGMGKERGETHLELGIIPVLMLLRRRISLSISLWILLLLIHHLCRHHLLWCYSWQCEDWVGRLNWLVRLLLTWCWNSYQCFTDFSIQILYLGTVASAAVVAASVVVAAPVA